jgi:hypothetical protein
MSKIGTYVLFFVFLWDHLCKRTHHRCLNADSRSFGAFILSKKKWIYGPPSSPIDRSMYRTAVATGLSVSSSVFRPLGASMAEHCTVHVGI